jgi:hypothetical protein
MRASRSPPPRSDMNQKLAANNVFSKRTPILVEAYTQEVIE